MQTETDRAAETPQTPKPKARTFEKKETPKPKPRVAQPPQAAPAERNQE